MFRQHGKKFLISIVLFSAIMTVAYCYPPDNAAVLYYKAAVLYEPDEDMVNALSDLKKGNIELNEKVKEFIGQRNIQRVIDTVTDASAVKNCDWGMDLSQGVEMDMPPLGAMRKLAYLLVADAKVLAAEGDYETALNRCMTLYKMARHINDGIFINHLVAVAINGVTNSLLIEIIAEMPQNTENFTMLKSQLTEIEAIPLSIKPAVLGELEACKVFMTMEQLPEIVRFCEMSESKKKIISAADQEFLDRSIAYFENYYATVIAAVDMPYVEGYQCLEDLEKKVVTDGQNNPDALLASVLAPATKKIISISVRMKTHDNAIKSAIEIYLIKAKTGKLPETLPAGLPNDMFSGGDFEYEITDTGFILRCQQRDLARDELYEYEFTAK